jgi:hypothetical protein
MRLGQIARKYKVKPKEILDSLNDEFEEKLEDNPNLKLNEDHLKFLEGKYKVEEIEEAVTLGNPYAEKPIKPSESIEKPVSEEEVTVPTKDEVEKVLDSNDNVEKPDDKKEETLEVKTEKIEETPKVSLENKNIEEIEAAVSDFVPEEIRESAEVIKAPKIELEGPKVIDKIDLPDAILNDMIEVDGVMIDRKEYNRKKKAEKDKERLERRQKRQDAKLKAERKKNSDDTLSFERNREKELEEEKKRIAKNKEKLKEERKKHYQEKHLNKKNAPQAKKKKSVESKVKDEELSVETIEAAFDNKEASPSQTTKKLNWWQRLWKWYNT